MRKSSPKSLTCVKLHKNEIQQIREGFQHRDSVRMQILHNIGGNQSSDTFFRKIHGKMTRFDVPIHTSPTA